MILLLSTGGKNGGGYEASKYVVIAIHGGLLLLHAIINSLPISWLSFFGQLAAAWNLLGRKHYTILFASQFHFMLANSFLESSNCVRDFRCFCSYDSYSLGCNGKG